MSFGKHFKLLSALSLVSFHFHFPSWSFSQFCKLHIFLGSLSHNNSQIKSTSVYTHLLKENYIPNFMFPSGNHIQQVTKNLIHFFIILSEMSEEEYKNENTLHYKADTSHSVCQKQQLCFYYMHKDIQCNECMIRMIMVYAHA